MRKEIEKYEQIERYLKEELHGKELESFEERLRTDPQFRSEVESHRRLFQIIDDGAFIETREKISIIHKKTPPPSGNNINPPMLLAILIVSGVLSFIIFNQLKEKSTEVRISSAADSLQTVTEKGRSSDVNLPELSENTEGPVLKTDSVPVALSESVKTEDSSAILNRHAINRETDIEITDTAGHIKDSTFTFSPDTAMVVSGNEPSRDEKRPSEIFQAEKTDSSDCSTTEITASVTTEKSCNNKPTGSIRVDEETVSGGEGPYTLSLERNTFAPDGLNFHNLKPGPYLVYITDRNNCKSSLGQYWISTYDCDYNFRFAPDKNERWKIPNHDGIGNLMIYNSSGAVVYRLNLDHTGEYYWDGCRMNGDMLPMGNYLFILDLEAGEKMHGSVTIIR